MPRVRLRDLWGHLCVFLKFSSMRQGATTTKHVYDLDAFHAFLQRLGPKLCRTGTCMG